MLAAANVVYLGWSIAMNHDWFSAIDNVLNPRLCTIVPDFYVFYKYTRKSANWQTDKTPGNSQHALFHTKHQWRQLQTYSDRVHDKRHTISCPHHHSKPHLTPAFSTVFFHFSLSTLHLALFHHVRIGCPIPRQVTDMTMETLQMTIQVEAEKAWKPGN